MTSTDASDAAAADAKAAFERTFGGGAQGAPGGQAAHNVQQVGAADLTKKATDASEISGQMGEGAARIDPPGSRPTTRPPICPGRCTAGGPGIGGGTAGATVAFVVTSADGNGHRLRVGGGDVAISVLRSGLGMMGGETIEGRAVDNGDGTYACTYAVPSRGDYSVTVSMNDAPISGSPFPVFFSAAPGAVPLTLTGGIDAPPGVCRDYLNGRCARAECKFPHAAAPSTGGAPVGMGAPGTAMPLTAAPDPSAAAPDPNDPAAHARLVAAALAARAQPAEAVKELQCTLHVGNLSPLVTVETLRAIFAFCGEVVDCRIADGKQFGFVEYATHEEALKGLGLNQMTVADRALKVEMSKTLKQKRDPAILPAGGPHTTVTATTHEPTPTAPTVIPPRAPMVTMAQQIQQTQWQQMQQAGMVPMVSQRIYALQQQQARETQQQKAMLAAEKAAERAAAISRRLAGGDASSDADAGGGAVAVGDDVDLRRRDRSRSRSRSRSRGRGRSSRSPRGRFGRRRSRSRSRSRDVGRRDGERYRAYGRPRGGEGQYDRYRGGGGERRYDRFEARDRGRSRSRSRDRVRDSKDRRNRSRERWEKDNKNKGEDGASAPSESVQGKEETK